MGVKVREKKKGSGVSRVDGEEALARDRQWSKETHWQYEEGRW